MFGIHCIIIRESVNTSRCNKEAKFMVQNKDVKAKNTGVSGSVLGNILPAIFSDASFKRMLLLNGCFF